MSENPPNPHVIEAEAETFLADVVERSATVPVVVDFWAEWCQPCRTLGPILERLADEHAGRFVLAKADTAKVSAIAEGFGVRSIPAVFGLRDGKIHSSFVGAQPEASVRAWLAPAPLPTPAETLAGEARALEAGDPPSAEAKYREAAALDPGLVAARAGLARLALAGGRIEEARSIVEALERRGFLEPEVETIRAELTLRSRAAASGDIPTLRAALAADSRDLPRQLALAEALAEGRTTEALDLALDLVERDRRNTGESARKLMIAVFQLLPPDSEVVADYRRRLSFAL